MRDEENYRSDSLPEAYREEFGEETILEVQTEGSEEPREVIYKEGELRELNRGEEISPHEVEGWKLLVDTWAYRRKQ